MLVPIPMVLNSSSQYVQPTGSMAKIRCLEKFVHFFSIFLFKLISLSMAQRYLNKISHSYIILTYNNIFQVYEGMNVVMKVNQVQTYEKSGRPKTEIKILSVSLK